jgi:hypothetical protein
LAEQIGRWVALLDELDRQVTASRAGFGLGNTTAGIWTIEEIRASIGPVGPLPESLIPRGRRILADYEEEFTRLQATKRLIGEHLEMLQSIRGSEDAQPLYLDQVG